MERDYQANPDDDIDDDDMGYSNDLLCGEEHPGKQAVDLFLYLLDEEIANRCEREDNDWDD
jgi:hypothetical protein